MNIHKILTIVSLSVLLSSCIENNNAEITVETIVKSNHSWNDALLEPYLEGQPQVQILKYTIPPHFKLPEHKHPAMNAGIVTKGKLRVISTQTNDTLIISKGEPIVELINTWHYGENISDEQLEIIVFYAGVEGVPITVKREDK